MKALSYSFSLFSLLIGCCFGLFACGGNGAEQAATAVDVVVSTNPAKPKAQALLLIQNFPYDATRKDSIAGKYTQQVKVTVPADLRPQNKWVMFEGPVLENDLVAYRFYMDSRHRFDIYGKRVHDLVMDTVSWQYHDIMDWGSDILKVGNSLGIGSPGVLYQDSIYTLSNYGEKSIEVIQAQGDIARIRTTFNDLLIGDQTMKLVQEWSLRVGRREADISLRVEKGSLPKGASFVTGVVNHDTDLQVLDMANSKAVFSWGKQSFHGENMGMAVFAKADLVDRSQENPLTHLLVFKPGLSEVDYSFMSAWERGVVSIKTQSEFQAAIIKATSN